MHEDDIPSGRILSRREALTLASTAGIGALLGFSRGQGRGRHALHAKPCALVSPAMTEGPYFVDEDLVRTDITVDPASGAVSKGVPLELVINLVSIDGDCRPLVGALVDVWHCDALGKYSNEAVEGTKGRKFLRGQQLSDPEGRVKFKTIYPGWYPGRAVHIHFKVRKDNREFTSQLFFDETTTDAVHAKAPYAARGRRDTPNAGDGIYRNGGSQLMLAIEPLEAGYRATFDVGLLKNG